VTSVVGFRGNQAFGVDGQRAEWFELLTGDQWRARMEFREVTASQFFAQAALSSTQTQAQSQALASANLVQDAGSLRINADQILQLNGQLQLIGEAKTGTGVVTGEHGRLEVTGNKVQVLANATQTVVAVDAARLNNSGAREIVLGARIMTEPGKPDSPERLVTVSNAVKLNDDVSLSAASLIVSSNQTLVVGDNARLNATAAAAGRPIDAMLRFVACKLSAPVPTVRAQRLQRRPKISQCNE
jgi:hypothetical protein